MDDDFSESVRLKCGLRLTYFFASLAELNREEEEQGKPFRSGAITPDGLIDEDFEEELGSPSQVTTTLSSLILVYEIFSSLSIDTNVLILSWSHLWFATTCIHYS